MGGVTTETQLMVKGVLESLLENGKKQGSRLSSPKWTKAIKKEYGKIDKKYDPDAIGKAISTALNENAPSMLLINDLHRLSQTKDVEQFLQILYAITNQIEPGVLVALSGEW